MSCFWMALPAFWYFNQDSGMPYPIYLATKADLVIHSPMSTGYCLV
ncbi:hypothetical protein PL8927_760033 [Planktothrix serta PCC 8927]|uniref:Uncharacterized protein n=1 Tax=Planktothrix serta PCC 8927 TaxID=671068 RepID=A0A7Z9E2N4_9CYAN|nr:hypothetical protein PL8927_760033 [Planktothrix serta PCC 8927]